MFVDWCILSLTEVFIQPQHTQCPSLCLMERTPLHMFGWLYVILLINRFYAICFCTDRSSRIIILFILFSLFVFSLFFPDIRFVLLYSPFSLCVPWLMIYTCCQKILCTDRSSRIIILFILFSLFVLSLFFPEICFVLLYAPTHPFPCVPWLPTGLFLMVEPSWPKIFTQNIFHHISLPWSPRSPPPSFPPQNLFSSTIFGCQKIKNEQLRLIAFKYYFKEKLCSPPLVCKYLGNFLNLILTMFTNKVSEGRWLTIFTIKFNFVLTIDNLIYIFENQITNIEHHLLNIGYQISSIKYWTSLRKYKKVSNGKLDIQYWIFTSEAFTSRG